MRNIVAIAVLAGTFFRADALLGSESTEALIRQLGHPDFQQRIAAERELLRRGPECMPAVTSGTASDEPEIRQRSRRLLDLLQRQAFVEQQRQIFKNPWVVSGHVVPQWELFHSYAGDGRAARALYVRILLQESDLMMLTLRTPDGWTSAFENRCRELRTVMERRFQQEVDLGSIAALVLLAMHPENKPSPPSMDTLNRLLQEPRILQMVGQAEEGPAVRSLLEFWVMGVSGAPATTRIQLADRYQLQSGVHPAREILAARQASMSLQTVRDAIMLLSRFGKLDVLPDLSALVEDESPLIHATQSRPGAADSRRPDLQVGDLALFELVKITGQDPRDYGFVELKGTSGLSPPILGATFPSSDTRKDAVLKWKSWSRRHLSVPSRLLQDASEGVPL